MPSQASTEQFPFRNSALPLAERVHDLFARLTVAEKIQLIPQYQAAVPRLGLRAIKTGTEVLHGVGWLGPATVFPQAVGLDSTWNPELLQRIGAAYPMGKPRAPLSFRADEDGIEIDLPPRPTDPWDPVIVLETDGLPEAAAEP